MLKKKKDHASYTAKHNTIYIPSVGLFNSSLNILVLEIPVVYEINDQNVTHMPVGYSVFLVDSLKCVAVETGPLLFCPGQDGGFNGFP